MKHRRPQARPRLSRNAEHLAWLAQGLANSGSRLEDAWWENAALALIEKLLKAGDDETLNQALERLNEGDTSPHAALLSTAYETLAELMESACEAHIVGDSGMQLIALPILAWSRYSIPARSVPSTVLETLRSHLMAHVLADGVSVHFATPLFSPDQLPQGYSQTRMLAERLFQAASEGHDLDMNADELAETQNFVSDVRYLLAAVQVRPGQPLFRWNEGWNARDASREACLTAWQQQATPNLQGLLTGCQFELLLPEAYFTAWRHADQATRPFALKSAAAYLQVVLNVPITELRVVVAPYFDRWLEEWRISFSLPDSEQVVHGVTWPILGPEEEANTADTPALIEAALKEAGIVHIQILESHMPLEYCDDCGAPLFPNAEGENMHTEMPEDMQDAPVHLH